MNAPSSPRGPLTGVRVLAVEQYGAGPFGTMLLADLGAEVVKIENRAEGGDVGRAVGPYHFSQGNSHFYQSFNRNKRSITLNLKHPNGKAILHRLVARSDAVMNNLRGDLPARLGLTHADLSAHNPKIVCAHLSAYGRTGSRANWPGYDYLMQAEAGYLSVTGEPSAPPSRFGLSVVGSALPLHRIRSVAVEERSWLYGYGWRWTPKGPLWRAWGHRVVALSRDDGRVTCLGSDDPEAMAEAIRRALARRLERLNEPHEGK